MDYAELQVTTNYSFLRSGSHPKELVERAIELGVEKADLDTLLATLEARTEGFDPDGLWSLIASETYLYALRDPAFAADYRAYHEASRNTFVRIVESLLRLIGLLL